MKKTRYTEEQIAFALKQAETGTRVEEVWTAPTTVDISCPHDEACSKASGLTPPRWL